MENLLSGSGRRGEKGGAQVRAHLLPQKTSSWFWIVGLAKLPKCYSMHLIHEYFVQGLSVAVQKGKCVLLLGITRHWLLPG